MKAIALYHLYKANNIVAEVNNGGDMVVATIKNLDSTVKVKKVHATRGKRIRAEPVSMLYEQRRIWHIGQGFKRLEDQMLEFNPEDPHMDSPDRVDAMVWAFTELIISASEYRIRHI
jgi:phage terminase large subunit-like protein